MKSKLIVITFLIVLFFQNNKMFSQTIIDYQSISPANCNIFSPKINVNTIPHKTVFGQPAYNTTNKSVILKCDYTSNFNKGTQYKLLYPFKQGYTYKITLSAKNMTAAAFGNIYDQIGLYMDNDNSLTNGNSSCNGPEVVSLAGSVNTINPDFFVDYDFNFYTLSSNYSTFYVYSTPSVGCIPIIQNIEIKKITITETPPPVSFTIPATTAFACGSTTATNFSVSNVYGTSGVTNYTWNLGATPNGWLYNNAAAPATVSTNTTNTISVTPVCGNVPKNISATVTANGTAYNTNTSTVSVTQPGMSINGSGLICTGSSGYSITGLPCNATISWATSPSAILTPATSTSATPTFTKTGNGLVTLSAVVTGCGSVQPALFKQISAGVYQPSQVSFLATANGGSTLYPQPFCLGATVYFKLDDYSYLDATSYQWTYAPNWQYISGAGTRTLGLRLVSVVSSQPQYPNTAYVGVLIGNACGSSNVINPTFYPYNPNCTGSRFAVSPNPSTDVISITQKEEAASRVKSVVEIQEVQIADKMGVIKLQQKFGKGISRATISVSALPNDVYTIRIFDGQNWQAEKIIIQH
jgi:hypothetical protein